MAYADLNGNAVIDARIVYPFAGPWHADLFCALPIDTAGVQAFNLDGVAWTCSIVRAADFAGERRVRVVGGLGGWRTTIPAKQYGGGSVTTLHILSDAAAACGEPTPVIDPSLPVVYGPAYLRPADVASYALQDIVGDGWWIDQSGTVQTAPRGGSVPSVFYALEVSGAQGVYDVATDFPADWIPGRTFANDVTIGTISRVTHIIRRDSFRTEVMV
jgi:hypothetical protein